MTWLFFFIFYSSSLSDVTCAVHLRQKCSGLVSGPLPLKKYLEGKQRKRGSKMVSPVCRKQEISVYRNQPWIGVFKTQKGFTGYCSFVVRIVSANAKNIPCFPSPVYMIRTKKKTKRTKSELLAAKVLCSLCPNSLPPIPK